MKAQTDVDFTSPQKGKMALDELDDLGSCRQVKSTSLNDETENRKNSTQILKLHRQKMLPLGN
ncbi:CLUMA_CG001426, isoform A [Clunio marinus]|uniref:CLUMA_CG001426, isoform A n=1 Tax=Clunio marinus TaxID=568069 RepID=A0A1J1HME7_9DIPT|nr:CLUMA_CG001426, isoform A [Clunio marinus]